MYKKILFLCFFYQTAAAQSETFITVDINLHHSLNNRPIKTHFFTYYLRCYKEYVFETNLKVDPKKYKTPADIKPPFFNDSSYNFIDTALHKFVEYDAFTVSAKPIVAGELSAKPFGIMFRDIPALDSAVRIADTTIKHITYIRYRGTFIGPKRTKVVTAYLLPGENAASYSYHRATEEKAHGRIVWIQDVDPATGAMYDMRFTYESRKIPKRDRKVMRNWINKTRW